MAAQALIIADAQAAGVDPSLALGVAQAESDFDQNAVSPAGAIGVMQLMPATAAQLGVDPTDLTQNIYGGITYLAQLLAQFGSPALALAAYNWGPGNVSGVLAKYGANWFNYIPASVQQYVIQILGSAPATPAAAAPAGSFVPSTSILSIPAAAPAPAATPWTEIALAFGLIFGIGYVVSEG